MARGSLEERGPGKWRLSVYVGVDDGRRRYRRETFLGTRRDAETRLAKLVTEVQGGAKRAKKAGPVTVADFLEKWITTFEGGWSPSTRRTDRSIVSVHLIPGLGKTKLSRLTTEAIDDFYASLAGRVEPAYVKRIHGTLHRALEVARVRWKLIPYNPASDARPGRVPPRMLDLPSLADVLVAIEAEPLVEVRTAFLFSLATGIRRGELAGLRWSDREPGGIWVRRRVIDGGPGVGIVVRDLTKMDRPGRWVDTDPVTDMALDSHRVLVEAKAALGTTPLGRKAYIFSMSADGSEPWRPDFLTKRWAVLRQRTGLPDDFRLHDLRHQHGSELLADGLDIRSVSERLGHARTSTTSDIYVHSVRRTDRRAADIMGRLLNNS